MDICALNRKKISMNIFSRKKTFFFLSFIALMGTACSENKSAGSPQASNGKTGMTTNSSTPNMEESPSENTVPEEISLTRTTVQSNPIQTYSEKIPRLADAEFKVELFETSETFKFRAEINHGLFSAIDTITIPNFGMLPEPILKKGETPETIQVGFLDKEKNFRPYKLISADQKSIQIKTIKYYATPKYQRKKES